MAGIPEYFNPYRTCLLCPNRCAVDRTRQQVGICRETDKVRVAWSGLHRGEEPPVTGKKGSGMIFFSGCPLHCAYCQNHQIAGCNATFSSYGCVVDCDSLVNMMLGLQDMEAANVNMVTGTHFIPTIAEAVRRARSQGFVLPIVWNSSGYESEEGLSVIDPLVDLHLVDFKTLDSQVAAVFCGNRRYAKVVAPMLEELVSRHPVTAVGPDGVLRGILVRHLVFPGTMEATREALRWYAHHLNGSAWLSLMVQFVPPSGERLFPRMTQAEYDSLIALLDELGIEDGFVQELGDEDSWIPDFRRDNPFPDGFAEPLPYFLSLRSSVR
ncbi:4Fe-4S cluster-binding domain-containing protein [Parasphaerochaeta coccoides]|uniref:Radical SAM domain protein n=1 Tax=Parasphaerochaeta coccoides (strain ATCC BAA-1237 / DSM 17374 / SPN1) TaxID=760011 RepID=F4GK82_PARC1|nr:4Fe-4S cluster-binding domain-containing protein [Parasphaerochaeta coccoides]AEC02278.1 Radical SAM domain protein [Parasphaerochaeta coccoides DSM 17374]